MTMRKVGVVVRLQVGCPQFFPFYIYRWKTLKLLVFFGDKRDDRRYIFF